MSILNHFFDYKPEVLALDEKAMELCQPYFRQMEEIRDFNQLKMLKAFADTQMSSTDMLGTTGYGLWDTGRAKLEQIFAQVMGAEDALVRSQFQSGTHTLAVALFGLLRAGDTLLAATGRPYDTLEGVIGLDGKGKGTGTLMDYGVNYDEAPLKADFTPDYDLIAKKAPGAKVCHIQRSRGYLQRNAFDLATIRKIADTARAANPDIIIFADEVLVALSICAASDPTAEIAMQQLAKLAHCEAHSSVILSHVDENVFKKLEVNITFEPHFQTKKLFHR